MNINPLLLLVVILRVNIVSIELYRAVTCMFIVPALTCNIWQSYVLL